MLQLASDYLFSTLFSIPPINSGQHSRQVAELIPFAQLGARPRRVGKQREINAVAVARGRRHPGNSADHRNERTCRVDNVREWDRAWGKGRKRKGWKGGEIQVKKMCLHLERVCIVHLCFFGGIVYFCEIYGQRLSANDILVKKGKNFEGIRIASHLIISHRSTSWNVSFFSFFFFPCRSCRSEKAIHEWKFGI